MDKKQNEITRIRTLLWSPDGSGEHYSGPASFTYRLYSSAPAGAIRLTLAHGSEQQEPYDLFHRQSFIAPAPFSPTIWQQYDYIKKGCRWIDEHRDEFDVMHSISAFHNSVVPAARAEKHGIPSVIFVSNHLTQLQDKKGWKKVLGLPAKRRKLVRSLSCLVAMSEDINDELLSYGVPESKIARIPMGVNTQLFCPASSKSEKQALRRRYGWEDLPTVVFVGSLVERKRPDLLIEAIGLLKKNGVDFQLVLAGPPSEPNYYKKMKQRVSDLNIDDQVYWIGFTQEIAPIYKAADIFCLPSTNEGMAAALIESMACGLAPVVTPVSGSADVVSSGENGFIVQQTAESIYKALSEYSSDLTLAEKHGQKSLAIARERFSNEVIYASYESLFRRLMAGQSAAL
ncbi:MAG: glycosyltransferase family 4 protein [Acidiferrobacterales bacterium]|nr:glycosyltransferase family 4 protein [Acidiferrobacterales bacterium]